MKKHRMNLYKKTFMYSCIISLVSVSLILGYFVFMMPSLYVDHMEKMNFEAIKNTHQIFLDTGNFNADESRESSYTFVIVIPKDKNEITLQNYLGGTDISINDEELAGALDKIKSVIGRHQDSTGSDSLDADDIYEEDIESADDILDVIKDRLSSNTELITMRFFGNDKSSTYEKVSSKVHIVSDDIFIFENNIKDDNNYYTIYTAFSEKDDNYIISVLPVMTPQMSQMKGIILDSSPMLSLLILCIILSGTMFFSRKIVEPITSLARHATYIKENKELEIQPFVIEGNDEIADLSRSINDMYLELNRNYNELIKKNKRQIMFLRASSHQLKTPIAASLLLTDSMINEIGKFKNTKEYLPVLRSQLISIKKLVEEILSINSGSIDIKKSKIDVKDMVMNIIESHKIECNNRKIGINVSGDSPVIVTNGEMLYKVVDNLFNNGVKFSEDNSFIDIKLYRNGIEMINYGPKIDENIIGHIFEPFVSGTEKKGHGLGLYIVSYYCDILGYDIKITNMDNGVKYILGFHKES